MYLRLRIMLCVRSLKMDNRVKIGPLPLLIVALTYYLTDTRTFFAFLMPAAAHEMGHLAALSTFSLRVKGIRLDMKGLCIEYSGHAEAIKHALAAAAGPLAGLVYAALSAWVAGKTHSQWAELSAGISLALSAFNMLPAMPLDGGRVLMECCCGLFGTRTGEMITRIISTAVGAVMLFAGIYAMYNGYGAALEVAAIWILLSQSDKLGIVKPREIM